MVELLLGVPRSTLEGENSDMRLWLKEVYDDRLISVKGIIDSSGGDKGNSQ